MEYPPVPVPANCVVLDDPASAVKCEVDEYALFVDGAAGDDGNPGTQARPLKTLKVATDREKLRGRRRIYLSDAPQAGNVVLPRGVSLAGGFRATDWGRPEGKTTTIAGAVGVDGIAKPTLFFTEAVGEDVVLSDLVVTAPPTKDGESSIGMFVAARSATLYRLDIHTGAAGDGSILPDRTNDRSGSAEGKPNAPAPNACTCLLHGTTTGGGGGPSNQSGMDGTSEPLAAFGGVGKGSNASCASSAGVGGDGAGGGGGTAIGAVGTIDSTGWLPTNGEDGSPGEPGAGGGGGGNGGGSGGCGGCGGAGGRGGRAGGSSLGIVGLNCNLTLVRTKVASEDAGSGHDGGAGGQGQDGGEGGGTTCKGGKGGIGGGGGGGAGGAAGLSAAVVYVNGTVKAEDGDTKLTSGNNGGKGGASGPFGPKPGTTGQEGRPGAQGAAAGAKAATVKL